MNTALAVCCVFGEQGGMSEFLESVKLYREVEFTISCNIAPDKKNAMEVISKFKVGKKRKRRRENKSVRKHSSHKDNTSISSCSVHFQSSTMGDRQLVLLSP